MNKKVVSMRNTPRNRDKFRIHLEKLGVLESINSALTRIYEATEDFQQVDNKTILKIFSECLGGYDINQANKELEQVLDALINTNARMERYITKLKSLIPKESLPAASDDESDLDEAEQLQEPDSTVKDEPPTDKKCTGDEESNEDSK